MENLVTQNLFGDIYRGQKVFLTGHTGFKGSWLSLWLLKLGAEVVGFSKDYPSEPNHFSLLNLPMKSYIEDIRDYGKLKEALKEQQPDIIFHLAAQPLVRESYNRPIETYQTNIIGTLNLYTICREIESVKAIVSITTDKVYSNNEWIWGYRENDRLGGYDPYSSSKACVEIMTNSIQKSYFNINDFGKTHNLLLATTRAGNVIGGGDWAEDRLVPDIVRSKTSNSPIEIRSPNSVRPWQHVLEPLNGYLVLGQKLLERQTEFAQAWNFGPINRANITVREICKIFSGHWKGFSFKVKETNMEDMHETSFLQLDSTKSFSKLNWKPIWDDDPFKWTIDWYKSFYENKEIITDQQLESYCKDLKKLIDIT